jgi:hypothetical protein
VYGARVRFSALAMIWAGVLACYEAPDYGPTMFRCDAARGCPDGQTCVGGVCRDDGGAAGDGVACGAQACAAGQQCCVDFVSAPRCLAAGAVCAGLGATCDGLEDCEAATTCCRVGARADCTAAACGDRICLEPADCPAAQPLCCFGLTAGEPWGHCGTICL